MVEETTAEKLVSRHLVLKDWLAAETKRFDEHLANAKKEMEDIDNQLLAMLNSQGMDSFKTDSGTAYLSTLMNVGTEVDLPYINSNGEQVFGKNALLDFAIEHWDEIGSEMLMVSAQKDAVKKWMEEHEGTPPPGCKIGFFTRVNVRRS